MKITYLGHSGFLVETDTAYFIFDFIRGRLPDLSGGKKIYVFASHAHKDHWNVEIFFDEKLMGADCYILGFDIEEPFKDMAAQNPELLKLPVIWAYPKQTIKKNDIICRPILSTDEGVAFLVRTENEVIYHAGDLNWWHWEEDPVERNQKRAIAFKREIEYIKDTHIDVAFVPLDPRQKDAYRFCMDYCMETLDADKVFPMHFWKDHELCRRYQESLKQDHEDWYERFQLISFEGEQFFLA